LAGKTRKIFSLGFERLRVIAGTLTAVSGDRTFAAATIGIHSSRGKQLKQQIPV
jgi:hypothetical protein